MTHLVGNYLGLYPLWGPDRCQDDYVEDTPVHNSPNYGDSHSGHISTCENVGQEMTMNFMDNTFDNTKYMFTKGQMLRMQATLSTGGPRNLLLSTSTQCDVSAAISDFLAESRTQEIEQDILEADLISINPNPASDYVDIAYNADNLGTSKLNVFSSDGRSMKTSTISGNVRFDISELPEGNYFMHFINPTTTIIKKLIIQ